MPRMIHSTLLQLWQGSLSALLFTLPISALPEQNLGHRVDNPSQEPTIRVNVNLVTVAVLVTGRLDTLEVLAQGAAVATGRSARKRLLGRAAAMPLRYRAVEIR